MTRGKNTFTTCSSSPFEVVLVRSSGTTRACTLDPVFVFLNCGRCPLCLDVLDQPTTTVPCGHTFCERCMDQNFNESEENTGSNEIPSTRCPVCRSVIRRDHLGPCWIVRDLIEGIVIRCDYGVSFDLDSEQYEAGVSAFTVWRLPPVSVSIY